MKMTQVKEIAKDRRVKPGRLNKEGLIRAIQQSEGNPQCYNSGLAVSCGEQDCLWREDCT